MKFNCKTFFDITRTGVTGHYKSSRVPFYDATGDEITDELSWNKARNQQRNWETITQLIGLRSQISNTDNPSNTDNIWEFNFEVETPYAFGSAENPTELLQSDSDGVPMLVGLGNKEDLEPRLVISGPLQNIWFNILE